MATASENARKVLNSIKTKLNLNKFPRGTFIVVFPFSLNLQYIHCVLKYFFYICVVQYVSGENT